MMGSGKSTVGRLVAAEIDCPLIDLDAAIESDAGNTVAEIFASEGEGGFREREERAVTATAGTDAVVACGGGVVLRPRNVELMRASGVVVWLDAPVAELARRVGDGAGRPLLDDQDIALMLGRIAAEREAAYSSACHHRVDTEGRTAQEVAEEVRRLWNVSM
jgi:shikimate kinase